MRSKFTIAAVLAAAAVIFGYWYLHRGPKLAGTDTIVLADFSNSTGDAVFDASLREGLAVSLGESPWLNIVSDEKVDEALRSLGRTTDDSISPQIAPKVCQRTSAKAYVAGSISKDGNNFSVALRAVNCATGDGIAKGESEARSRDAVLHALGTAANELRAELGEGQDSLQKFSIPLERATTTSVEALKAYSQGRKLNREKGAIQAVPFFKKAIELDPRFALAHSNLAVGYYNLNQNALASDEIRQAFELGDRQTARDRLHITTLYYDLGTGDVQKAITSYKEWTQLYPRDDIANGNLSSEFFLIGKYEEAASAAQEALRLDPGSAAWYENLSTADISLLRLDQAQAVLNEAISRKLDDPAMHADIYALAFLRSDSPAMEREVAWTVGKPGGEDALLALQADTEAYSGHLKKARELSRRAVESAMQAQLAEPAAIWEGLAALREAVFGYPDDAKKGATEVLKIAPESRDAQVLAALVFARANDARRAQAIVDDLGARYVSNTVIQKAWLPTILAQLELLRQNPAKAIEILEPVKPFERGQLIGNLSNACLVPVYLRGEAYLSTRQGLQALAEFQKIQDSKGVVVNCWAGSLSRLGQARAQALAGYSTAARGAYQDFLSQWKDADSNIPILKSARTEFAKLK
ncbi:MAG: tetratricopeptide repeat protein [Candidatus Acidiferrales bacterium]